MNLFFFFFGKYLQFRMENLNVVKIIYKILQIRYIEGSFFFFEIENHLYFSLIRRIDQKKISGGSL